MHSPEPGRDISLGSSRIPRICVLWETQTRLTVVPARPPVPGTPAHLPRRPAHAPGPCSGVSAASALGPCLPAEGRRAAQGPWAAARGSGASATQGLSAASAPPGPAQGGPGGGGGPPAAPTPTTRPLTEPLPNEWSSLNIHFMAAAGKGCSRLSEPRSSANQPQQQRRQQRRRRRPHGRRDFRLPEPSNRPGAGLPAALAGGAAPGGGAGDGAARG